MTQFVHLDYSTQHAGVERMSTALASAQHVSRNFSSSCSLATLLLSAMAAALMVAAYQVMDSLAEGHLLVLWMGMWLVAFGALAAFAGPATRAAANIKAGLDQQVRRRAAKRADARLWAMAQTDSRLMAELQHAMARG